MFTIILLPSATQGPTLGTANVLRVPHPHSVGHRATLPCYLKRVFFGFFWVSHNTWQMHVNKQVIKYPFATPLHAMGAWLALLAATCVNADTLHSCIYTGTATCEGEPGFCTQEVMAPENCAFQLTIQGSGCKALPTMFGMSSSTSVYCAADDEHLKLLEIKDTWRRQCTYSNNDCTAWVGKEPNCVEYNYANTAGSGSDVCTSLCATADCGACVPYLQSTGELGSAAQTAFAEMVVGSAWYDPAIYATFRTTCGLPSGAPTIDTDIMGSHFYDLSGNLPVLTLPTTTTTTTTTTTVVPATVTMVVALDIDLASLSPPGPHVCKGTAA